MKLALGTVQFGLDYGVSNSAGQVNKLQVKEILKSAHRAGISVLDCASVYGNSEQVLGELEVSRQFSIVTKIPKLDSKTKSIIPLVKNSLNLLNVEHLEAVLFHHADDLLLHPKRKTFYRELAEMKQQGVVNRVGASLYSPQQWQQLKKQYQLDLLQVPANVLDQRFVSDRLFEDYQKHGVKIHCRSAFLQGLLLMPATERPQYFKPYQATLEKFDQLAITLACSPLTLCLALFDMLARQIKANPKIDDNTIEQIVVGCCSHAQLDEIVEAYHMSKQLPLSTQELTKKLSELSSQAQALINPSLWQITK
ncbi:aldo/keto reductase [Thalassotalea euphylliae]|uniref:NADP-dependent oxidoreductase domain-containing protein n=1 Tax=Thalassotalea euphylliae TaxID=1655234 RepID=A0A3E0UGE6_9GAMM|nr:aldo/keto reductase [Thalassotalea euphylliae]REL34822.1 hypothetical protein DXX92_05305 [Thalassotalea euphylliae]